MAPPEAGWLHLAEANEATVYESLVLNAHLPGFKVTRGPGFVALQSTVAPAVLVANRVLAVGVGQPLDEPLLDRLLSMYGDAGFGLEVAAPLCTPELLGWLKARRFRRIAHSQMMVCEVSRAASDGRYEVWSRNAGLRIEQIGIDRDATVAALCCANFNVPAPLGELVRMGTRGPGWRRWLAFDGDTAVGASLSHVRGGVGWFGWTSVSPSHRGRWIHAGFAARQFEDALASGCRWVTTDTAHGHGARPDPVRMNLKRFGFVDAHLRPFFVRAPVRRGA